MIVSKETKLYGVKCDKCGKIQEYNYDGESIADGYYDIDPEGAEQMAIDSEWHQDYDKHYCSECWEKMNEDADDEDSEEKLEHKNIADSILLAARVLKSNCLKINCQECVLCRNEECLLNQHPAYWDLNGDKH